MEAVSIMNWHLPRKFAITKSGRKGRDVIRSGPLPLRGETEEVGDYTGGDPPWGVSG